MAGAAVAGASERVLLCGDVNGKFRALVRLLQQVQQRQGPFGVVICCGNFFGGSTPANSSSDKACSSNSIPSSDLRGGNSSISPTASSSRSTSASSSGGAISSGDNIKGDAPVTSVVPLAGETRRDSLASTAAPAAATAGAAPSSAVAAAEDETMRSVTCGAGTSSLVAPEGDATGPPAAADAPARSSAAEGDRAAPATSLLVRLLRDSYSEALKELESAAVTLPMPLYFIDECVSSLMSVDCGEDGREVLSAGGIPGYSETPSPVSAAAGSLECAGSPGDAAAAAPGDPPGSCTERAEQRSEGKQQSRLPSPQQLCTNVFWLGRAGIARVSGLKIAFCAVSDAEEQLLVQQEQQQQKEQQQQQQGSDVKEDGEGLLLCKRRRLTNKTTSASACCALGSGSSSTSAASPYAPAAAAAPASEVAAASDAAGATSTLPFAVPIDGAGAAETAVANSRRRVQACWWQKVIAAAASPQWKGRTDIFLSCRWPADVLQQLQPLLPSLQNSSSTASPSSSDAPAEKLQLLLCDGRFQSSILAARLAAVVEARYLFAASLGIFYQRPPFRTPLFGYISRFTSLGFVGGKTSEAKPLHALQLQPLDTLLAALSEETQLPGALRPLPSPPLDSNSEGGGGGGGRGCMQETAVSSPEKKRENRTARAETARAALASMPSSATASPFASFLPLDVQQQLDCSTSKHVVSVSGVSSAGDGAAFDVAGGRNSGSQPSSSVAASAAASSHLLVSPVLPLPPPPLAAEGRQQQQKPLRPCCVVCVCNLPYHVDDGSLQKVMEAFGEVKFIYAPRDPEEPSKGTGKAFVVFVESQSADRAVEASGQLEAGRRVLRVAFWREKIPFAHRQQQQGQALKKAGSVLVTEAHAECWFCLANPKAEKHLVAAVGDACYTAAPKGGLHALHALIIPITHFPSVAFAPADVREEIGRQVEAYRRALKQQENLDCIVYERYVPMRATKAMHTQVQCVPCTTAQGYRAAEIFKRKAKAAGIALQPLDCTHNNLIFSDLPQLVKGTGRAYFYLDLPGMNTASGHRAERLFYCQPSPSGGGDHRGGRSDAFSRLPMNFGREVVATVIDRPEMADWQKCIENQNEETTRAAQLTKLLSP